MSIAQKSPLVWKTALSLTSKLKELGILIFAFQFYGMLFLRNGCEEIIIVQLTSIIGPHCVHIAR